MPTSVRVAVVLVVLGGWSVVVGFTLAQGKLPDVAMLGVPGAVLLAASPLPSKLRGATPRKRTPAKKVAPKPAEDTD